MLYVYTMIAKAHHVSGKGYFIHEAGNTSLQESSVSMGLSTRESPKSKRDNVHPRLLLPGQTREIIDPPHAIFLRVNGP